jgi:hypothetical protein
MAIRDGVSFPAMSVLAIDPGCERSAWVLWNGVRVRSHGISENEDVLGMLYEGMAAFTADALVIEEIASYGMPVGREVFQTVRWCGRFEQEAIDDQWTSINYMLRRDVKLHLCGQPRAKDTNVRQALIDRFGGKGTAIGKKASPGPLYGLKADEWQALALAVTFYDRHQSELIRRALESRA